jgi:undecaprenyl diphosphate synthase
MSDIADLPTHVGIILDGNRRWAKQQGLPTLEGHRRGAEVLKDIAKHAFARGIKHISAYIFSTENWRRTEEEVGYLMDLAVKTFGRYLDEFSENGVKVIILGRRDGLRAKVLESIKRTEEATKNNSNGTLALCFNYSGRDEILDATQKLIEANQPIDEEALEKALYYPELPELDLIIRTSGEQRLSGFMLWRAAYSEFYFTPVMWPAFTVNDFNKALSDYAKRKRRFGT